ncbi:LysR substrate-binding domain-containing protein [Collimonas silvisoli]|uniref:LysR substrate-binding domain-containing protein n=1 Tax=Collimonas silvisoli TaxID=2825884 RepID=UPI001B8D96DC|nr:LysR substrate-binding domain-containing protein [Collimonas silvisoli]
MKRALPPLLALRAFEAAARGMSFTNAALELNVTQSAISRQVRTLEDYLQRKLFTRLTRKIELTEEGKAYYQAVGKMFAELEEATALAKGRRARTVLTISVLPTVASFLLTPRLSSFWQSNKDIEVRIISSTEPVNFHTQQIDMAIKVGPLPGKRYHARRPRIGGEMAQEWRDVRADLLFPNILATVCSKLLIESKQPLTSLSDLAHYRLIHTMTQRYAWQDWLSAHDVHFDPLKNAINCGQYFMSLQAARDGQGIALVPSILVDSFDPNGDLARPFPAKLASAGEYYLLTPKARYEERAIKRFREWILAQAVK